MQLLDIYMQNFSHLSKKCFDIQILVKNLKFFAFIPKFISLITVNPQQEAAHLTCIFEHGLYVEWVNRQVCI